MILSLILFLFQAFQPRFVSEVPLIQNSDSLISQAWTMEDGLPVNTVNDIVQDKKGYIWFTTYDGIVRFDGINFKIYNYANTPEMPQNRAVFTHLQEGTGIWVTLEHGGIVLIDEEGNFTHFDENDGFTSSNTTYMLEDSRGRMWFCTFSGLYRYEHGAFSQISERDSPEKNRISFIFEDIDNSFWVSTHDGLIHLQQDTQTVYNVAEGKPRNEFRRVLRANSGELLVSALQGLYLLGENGLYIPDKFSFLKDESVPYIYVDDEITLISADIGLYKYDGTLKLLKEHGRSNLFYLTFYRDTQGILWGISTHGEIIQIKDDEVVTVDGDNFLPGYYYNDLLEDREQNMWFATARNGLVRVKQSQVQTMGKEEGLSGNNILGLFEDSQGRFWVGTRDYGLNVIDGNKITQYREADISSRDIVQTINEDFDGNIWVGYYQGGLDRFSGSDITTYDLGFGAGINDVRSVFVHSDSTIWLGTYGGLVKFDPDNENHIIYTTKEGLADNLIRYIDEDESGGLWIGTMAGGVSYFKDGVFTNYTIKDGLASNNIRAVYVDEYDPETVWIGSENNGVSRIRNGEIHSLSTSEGLPDHAIHYISEDRFGWLWMSSNRGIFKINKADLNAYLDGKRDYFDLVHFGKEEGMVNPEANGSIQAGGLKTSEGTFWFATQEGVAIFDITPHQTNEVPPTVLIDNFWANGKEYTSSEVELSPGTQSFEVNFKALTFVSPTKTRFRYKLEGFEEEWNEVMNERTASYTNVAPGEYTFRVTAANNDGIWEEEGAVATLKIPRVFYQQAWFYFLVGLLILAGYYGVSKIRYQYLMRKQEKLEEVIEEQTAQLRQEKDELEEKSKIIEQQALELEESNKTKDKFFSLIAHDLRNPFQAILGYSEMMLIDIEELDRNEIKTNLEHIHTSSKYLLNLVEHLLSWASLHTGKIQPEPEQVNLKELMERIVQLFKHVANQKNIQLESSAENDLYLNADLNMLETVLRNIVSNALKFTPKGGDIVLDLLHEEKNYIIEIEDNGIGMSQKLIDDLLRLDANSSRAGTNNEKGTGLGLLICKEMVHLHNGEIMVDSKENVGTKFSIKLPIEGISNSADSSKNMKPD